MIVAARRLVHAGDRANQRGLAGAVGADDGDDRALLDLQRNAVERLRVAVEQVEVFDLAASGDGLLAEIGVDHGRVAHDFAGAPCAMDAP